MEPVKGMKLKKIKVFATSEKYQFKIKVRDEGNKHSYIIPAKHSYQYLSSIVMVLWDMPSIKWYMFPLMA